MQCRTSGCGYHFRPMVQTMCWKETKNKEVFRKTSRTCNFEVYRHHKVANYNSSFPSNARVTYPDWYHTMFVHQGQRRTGFSQVFILHLCHLIEFGFLLNWWNLAVIDLTVLTLPDEVDALHNYYTELNQHWTELCGIMTPLSCYSCGSAEFESVSYLRPQKEKKEKGKTRMFTFASVSGLANLKKKKKN